jgi:hypothetical protein
MPFSGGSLRTEVSEKNIVTIIMVTGIGELRTLAVTGNRSSLRRNGGSYKSHTA